MMVLVCSRCGTTTNVVRRSVPIVRNGRVRGYKKVTMCEACLREKYGVVGGGGDVVLVRGSRVSIR